MRVSLAHMWQDAFTEADHSQFSLQLKDRRKGAPHGPRHGIWDFLQIGRSTNKGDEMHSGGFIEGIALLGSKQCNVK